MEHYEIAAYGTVRAFAEELGESEHASLLEETLEEEKETDEKLTELAKHINAEANEGSGEAEQRQTIQKKTNALMQIFKGRIAPDPSFLFPSCNSRWNTFGLRRGLFWPSPGANTQPILCDGSAPAILTPVVSGVAELCSIPPSVDSRLPHNMSTPIIGQIISPYRMKGYVNVATRELFTRFLTRVLFLSESPRYSSVVSSEEWPNQSCKSCTLAPSW